MHRIPGLSVWGFFILWCYEMRISKLWVKNYNLCTDKKYEGNI